MPERRPPVDVKGLAARLRELRGDRSREDVVRSIEAQQGYRMLGQYIYLIENEKVDNPTVKAIDALAREYARTHGPWVTVEYLLYGVRPAKKRGA